MTIVKWTAIGVVALGTVLAGCAQTPHEQRTATGAALGAAGGALLGAAVANSSAPPGGPDMCRYRAPDGSIYVAECDERYYRGGY